MLLKFLKFFTYSHDSVLQNHIVQNAEEFSLDFLLFALKMTNLSAFWPKKVLRTLGAKL